VPASIAIKRMTGISASRRLAFTRGRLIGISVIIDLGLENAD
jgi:hypothetical protein